LRFLVLFLLALLIGVGAGLGSALLAVEKGAIYGSVTIGRWVTWPTAGTRKPDPYTRAMLARSRHIPLGAGEGLAFTTRLDSDGEPLSGDCDYVLSGTLPSARLWTLTVTDTEGRFAASPSGRLAIHSREILISGKDGFSVRLSANAAPGNWLPVPAGRMLVLTMRLYDTPIGSGLDIRDVRMPGIRRERCR